MRGSRPKKAMKPVALEYTRKNFQKSGLKLAISGPKYLIRMAGKPRKKCSKNDQCERYKTLLTYLVPDFGEKKADDQSLKASINVLVKTLDSRKDLKANQKAYKKQLFDKLLNYPTGKFKALQGLKSYSEKAEWLDTYFQEYGIQIQEFSQRQAKGKQWNDFTAYEFIMAKGKSSLPQDAVQNIKLKSKNEANRRSIHMGKVNKNSDSKAFEANALALQQRNPDGSRKILAKMGEYGEGQNDEKRPCSIIEKESRDSTTNQRHICFGNYMLCLFV